MTNDEIKEAIGYISGMIRHPVHNKLSEEAIRYLKSIISLAEEYLKIEGWPKEQLLTHDTMGNNVCQYSKAMAFNFALRLCKLAAMKEKNKVSSEQIESLTEELLELINGKEKE